MKSLLCFLTLLPNFSSIVSAFLNIPATTKTPLLPTKQLPRLPMIRPVQQADLPVIKRDMIDANELFPSEMLDDMIAPFLNSDKSQQEGEEEDTSIWLTEVAFDGNPVSIVYCIPEKMTVGTYNALLLAVAKSQQGQGLGTRLMKYLEDYLKSEKQARILLVETSGTAEYTKTRDFYEKKLAYDREGCIRDFYDDGDDKIIYRKKLN